MGKQVVFDPQAGYVVTASSAFVNFNDTTFATFYQPIIGPVAFSLFYALKAQLRPNPLIADRMMQSKILAQLNVGSRQVAQAIHRLEAAGLLQTYFGHDDLGDVYVYQLQATLTPEQFIDDDLLSILLLEEIGDQAFEQLVKAGRQYELMSSNTKLKNVSHHFFDEFHVNSRSVTATPSVISTARHSSPVEQTPVVDKDLNDDDFNWQTLNGLLATQPVVKEDLEDQRELILVEHKLYGIDEPTMKQLILRAIDLDNNHFDAQKFKRIVASTYNVIYTSANDKVAEKKQLAVTNGNNILSPKDYQLIKSVQDYSPVEFLQVLKGQTGGYVTSGERHILTRLVENEKLPSEAINVLTWYVIVDRGNSTLSTNFVDAIANNWIRNKVGSGEEALVQLKEHYHQTDTKQKQTGHKRKRWRKTIKEPMPEWSRKDSKELNKKASAQTIANLKKQIANRKK